MPPAIPSPPDATEPTIMVRMDDVRLNVRAGCLPRSDIAEDAILRELGRIEESGKGICLLTDAEEQRLAAVRATPEYQAKALAQRQKVRQMIDELKARMGTNRQP